MFDGFTEFDLSTSEGSVHGRRGGAGPPVLLLHGIPETHLMWHRVAPALGGRFTVVATDLRGFGASSSPPAAPDHAPNSMRAIGREQVEVMALLGFERFAVVGHDRGARCAYRMAIDHPEVVERLAVLDVVPTGEAYRRADKDFALGYWVWSLLAAPAPIPERLIAAEPELLVNHMLDSWSEDPTAFPDQLRAAYVEPFTDPATRTRDGGPSGAPFWCCGARWAPRLRGTTRWPSGPSGRRTWPGPRWTAGTSCRRKRRRRRPGTSWSSSPEQRAVDGVCRPPAWRSAPSGGRCTFPNALRDPHRAAFGLR
jgi:pimeloyl-ACP methyl ester carboxylesterase